MPKIMIIGGVPNSLVNFRGDLIEQWQSLGYAVVALAAPAPQDMKQKIEASGAVFKPIPIERDGLNPIKDLQLIYRLYKLIKSEKPDMIFSYTVKPVIYGALSSSLTVKTSYYAMITGLGFVFTGQSGKQKILKKVLAFLYRKALKHGTVVFFQNKDDLAAFKDLNIISDHNKVVLVKGSGVNTEHFFYCEPKVYEPVSFLLVGRLLKSKGIVEYAKAAKIIKAKHKQVSFKLLGPYKNFSDSVSKIDLDRWQEEGTLEYLGFQRDVRPFIEKCSVYVLPSYREGTPRTVLEAMAMGRPIVTTDAPGCRETVQDGVNGFLVPVKDSEKLAEVMERFIQNPGLISSMGLESRRIAEEKFDVHKVNRVIIEAMGLVN